MKQIDESTSISDWYFKVMHPWGKAIGTYRMTFVRHKDVTVRINRFGMEEGRSLYVVHGMYADIYRYKNLRWAIKRACKVAMERIDKRTEYAASQDKPHTTETGR